MGEGVYNTPLPPCQAGFEFMFHRYDQNTRSFRHFLVVLVVRGSRLSSKDDARWKDPSRQNIRVRCTRRSFVRGSSGRNHVSCLGEWTSLRVEFYDSFFSKYSFPRSRIREPVSDCFQQSDGRGAGQGNERNEKKATAFSSGTGKQPSEEEQKRGKDRDENDAGKHPARPRMPFVVRPRLGRRVFFDDRNGFFLAFRLSGTGVESRM